MNTKRKSLERTRSAYIPLKPAEKRKLQAIADREGRSLGGQMWRFVLDRLDSYKRRQDQESTGV